MDRERLIEELAFRWGLSTEEVEHSLNSVLMTVESAVEAFNKLIETVKIAAEKIVDYFSEQEFYNPKPYWRPVLDTRIPSQVSLNKPRYMVRKIIR